MSGAVSLDILDGSGRAVNEVLGVGMNAATGAQAVAVLVGDAADANAAKAGWIITQNATGQTLSLWTNNTAGAKPSCSQAGTTLPDVYVPGFAMCPGMEGGMFPTFLANITLGALGLNQYQQGSPALSTGTFASAADGCAPLTIMAPGSPFGGGAFTMVITAGEGVAPPASMITPPAACGFTAW